MRRVLRRWFASCAALLCTPLLGGELRVDVRDQQGNPLADAVVFVEPLAAPAAPPAEPPKASIDQIDKQFVPRVSVIRAGTIVSFPNSDNIRHSVYSFSPAKVFTTKLYAGRQAEPITFDKSGVIVLGCNIHDQMLAWAVIVDTPHFGKTAADGTVAISALAAGEYRLNTWYPGLTQPISETIQVSAATTQRQVRIDASHSPLPRSQT